MKPASVFPLRARFGSALVVALALFSTGWSSSLRDSLSPEEFQLAGLGKLSADELAQLERLVEVRRDVARAEPAKTPESPAAASPAALPRGDDAFGNEVRTQKVVTQIQKPPTELHSRIVGEFNGWSGNTTFVLENGQVWRQAEPNEFPVRLSSPGVIIRKGALGTYFLSVDGYNSRVKVRRVK